MKTHHLFEVFGVELEYMLVRRDTLDVLPEADRLLAAEAGEIVSEVRRGDFCWSNELVLHLVELKVAEPVPSLRGLGPRFARQVTRLNSLLHGQSACLMPTAAHPWMDPDHEARLWPHEGAEIYREFDRIFTCRSHGWTNVQSMHLNLPFADDEEFGRLHAAIRVLLPIIPALAASSPFLDGRATGLMDSRMEAYRTNARKVPSVSGYVIPEPIFHIDQYQTSVLETLYRDLAPHDAGGILRYEWVNARGAIPRFERNTIEIRVTDVQECPSADLAVATAVVEVLRGLVAETWTTLEDQKSWSVEPLRHILADVVRDADRAVIRDRGYLRTLGYAGNESCTAGDLWRHLIWRALAEDPETRRILDSILTQGCLARRMVQAAGVDPDRARLLRTYRRLCECLAEDRFFHP